MLEELSLVTYYRNLTELFNSKQVDYHILDGEKKKLENINIFNIDDCKSQATYNFHLTMEFGWYNSNLLYKEEEEH